MDGGQGQARFSSDVITMPGVAEGQGRSRVLIINHETFQFCFKINHKQIIQENHNKFSSSSSSGGSSLLAWLGSTGFYASMAEATTV